MVNTLCGIYFMANCRDAPIVARVERFIIVLFAKTSYFLHLYEEGKKKSPQTSNYFVAYIASLRTTLLDKIAIIAVCNFKLVMDICTSGTHSSH